MDLQKLKKVFVDNGCQKIYVKELAPNDNSRNQVYLGGSEVLNMLPVTQIRNVPAGTWRRERFIASSSFSWIDDNGDICPAPHAKLILYPKYPEVRLSAFLRGCPAAPKTLMTGRQTGRLLFLGVTENRHILGYVVGPRSGIAQGYRAPGALPVQGIFHVIDLPVVAAGRQKLLEELRRIHLAGWIDSKRLDRNGNIMNCNAPNCGGYTLEAELGITPNGNSQPDYLGWELKQFAVRSFRRTGSAVITLMTPEPTGGYYKTRGAAAFIRKYGYHDPRRADRMNFGGLHYSGIMNRSTGLTLELRGFDVATCKIRNTDGKIVLVDGQGNEAASWSFSSLLQHWNRKHNQACYVPSLLSAGPPRQYRYGNEIKLCTGTDFQLFLAQMASGNIYYDPGIKMENASSAKPDIKKRSQFRMKSCHLGNLYGHTETVTLVP